MPVKLKSSARRSRRNKKIAIGVFVIALIAISAMLVFIYGRPSPVTPPVVQGKVVLQTSMGNITIELRDDKPKTSENFKNLVQQGLYNGTIFHRVIEGFMVQGGKINQSIPAIPDEIGSDNHNLNGTVAMANAGPNTATSEFFINVANNTKITYPDGSKFDGSYTVFGKVIDGMDVVMAISRVPVDDPTSQSPKPLQDVTIIRVTVLP